MKNRFELFDGERIIFEDTIHWKNYIFPTAGLCFAFMLFVIRMSFPRVNLLTLVWENIYVSAGVQIVASAFEGIVLIIFMGAMFVRNIQIKYTRYYVTDKRIISISGILHVRYQEMLLRRCEMVYLNQRFYERLYSSGDILCVSAGGSLFLDDVRNAQEFKQAVLERIAQMKEDGKE